MRSVRWAIMALVLASCAVARAQQPFYTDDAHVADLHHWHIESNNEYDFLPYSSFPNLRQDGINEWSPSVTKRFAISEKASLQLRCEAYNVLNHPVFAAPNTTATNSAFGTITSALLACH